MENEVTSQTELTGEPQANAPQDAPAQKEDQAPPCKRCSKPALSQSRFCEDHQTHAIPPETRRGGIRRIDIILSLLVIGIVLGYPKVSELLIQAMGRAAPSEPTGKTGVLDTVPAPAAVPDTNDTQHTTPASAPVALPVAAGASALCGNNVVDPGEQCDGSALAGATCISLGFSGDCDQHDVCVHAGLRCLGSCTFDYSGCTSESQGASQRFVDRGDSTASDRLTGLTWELKCSTPQCADRHDVLTAIAWHDAAVDWVTSLNAEQFAGHTDWRLPTLEELRTLLAAVPPCPAEPCPVAAWRREQTAAAGYWSSTSFSVDNHRAWVVSFYDGDVYTAEKDAKLHIRAVRTGF